MTLYQQASKQETEELARVVDVGDSKKKSSSHNHIQFFIIENKKSFLSM